MSQSSSTAELNSIPTISNGFWEIGNYKSNIHRIHQGSEQLEDFCRFIKDRIAIESNYSKSLERWNTEWGNYSEKYLKEGTVKETFDKLLEESFELSKIHRSIKERFNDEVLKTVELYKRDNYHKSTFRGFKEAKEIEDEFEKAQKQWKKLYEKVESSKKIYYGLARAEKSAYIQYMNSKADPSIEDNQSEKCKEERYQKCRNEMERAKAHYKQQINEINEYNSIYVESMAFIFEKCQRMEMKRLRFYVEMLSGMQKILVDMLNPPKLVQLHAKLRQHFLEANDAALGEDLKKWSQNHGVDSNTKWPEFEEYAGEFRQIHSSSGKSKQKQQQEVNGVVLTKKVLKEEEGEGRWRKAELNGWRGTTESEGSGSLKGGVNRNGQQFDKQNSIESRTTSSSTSKSSSNRSQSEKPHPRPNNNNAQQQSRFQIRNHLSNNKNSHPEISRPQQQMERFNLCPTSSTISSFPPIDDPLASDPPFPMVTPKKGKEEEKQEGKNKVGINFFNSNKGNGNGMLESKSDGKEQLATEQSTEMEPFEQIGPPSMQIGPAKVLYDYKPFEDDEIQLAKGETIEVLSGPDHLGWCLGVKKNKERGLFPAAYVSPILQMNQ